MLSCGSGFRYDSLMTTVEYCNISLYGIFTNCYMEGGHDLVETLSDVDTLTTNHLNICRRFDLQVINLSIISVASLAKSG